MYRQIDLWKYRLGQQRARSIILEVYYLRTPLIISIKRGLPTTRKSQRFAKVNGIVKSHCYSPSLMGCCRSRMLHCMRAWERENATYYMCAWERERMLHTTCVRERERMLNITCDYTWYITFILTATYAMCLYIMLHSTCSCTCNIT